MKNSNTPNLLVVEDSVEDFMAMERTFKKMNFQIPIHRCEDGYEAIDFLTKSGDYVNSTASLPSLILLDLNLPGINGNTVLKRIKATKDFNTIPVVVFTTSTNYQDINECYSSGGNCYIVKPIEHSQFEVVLKNVINFWLENVQLPIKDA